MPKDNKKEQLEPVLTTLCTDFRKGALEHKKIIDYKQERFNESGTERIREETPKYDRNRDVNLDLENVFKPQSIVNCLSPYKGKNEEIHNGRMSMSESTFPGFGMEFTVNTNGKSKSPRREKELKKLAEGLVEDRLTKFWKDKYGQDYSKKRNFGNAKDNAKVINALSNIAVDAALTTLPKGAVAENEKNKNKHMQSIKNNVAKITKTLKGKTVSDFIEQNAERMQYAEFEEMKKQSNKIVTDMLKSAEQIELGVSERARIYHEIDSSYDALEEVLVDSEKLAQKLINRCDEKFQEVDESDKNHKSLKENITKLTTYRDNFAEASKLHEVSYKPPESSDTTLRQRLGDSIIDFSKRIVKAGGNRSTLLSTSKEISKIGANLVASEYLKKSANTQTQELSCMLGYYKLVRGGQELRFSIKREINNNDGTKELEIIYEDIQDKITNLKILEARYQQIVENLQIARKVVDDLSKSGKGINPQDDLCLSGLSTYVKKFKKEITRINALAGKLQGIEDDIEEHCGEIQKANRAISHTHTKVGKMCMVDLKREKGKLYSINNNLVNGMKQAFPDITSLEEIEVPEKVISNEDKSASVPSGDLSKRSRVVSSTASSVYERGGPGSSDDESKREGEFQVDSNGNVRVPESVVSHGDRWASVPSGDLSKRGSFTSSAFSGEEVDSPDAGLHKNDGEINVSLAPHYDGSNKDHEIHVKSPAPLRQSESGPSSEGLGASGGTSSEKQKKSESVFGKLQTGLKGVVGKLTPDNKKKVDPRFESMRDDVNEVISEGFEQPQIVELKETDPESPTKVVEGRENSPAKGRKFKPNPQKNSSKKKFKQNSPAKSPAKVEVHSTKHESAAKGHDTVGSSTSGDDQVKEKQSSSKFGSAVDAFKSIPGKFAKVGSNIMRKMPGKSAAEKKKESLPEEIRDSERVFSHGDRSSSVPPGPSRRGSIDSNTSSEYDLEVYVPKRVRVVPESQQNSSAKSSAEVGVHAKEASVAKQGSLYTIKEELNSSVAGDDMGASRTASVLPSGSSVITSKREEQTFFPGSVGGPSKVKSSANKKTSEKSEKVTLHQQNEFVPATNPFIGMSPSTSEFPNVDLSTNTPTIGKAIGAAIVKIVEEKLEKEESEISSIANYDSVERRLRGDVLDDDLEALSDRKAYSLTNESQPSSSGAGVNKDEEVETSLEKGTDLEPGLAANASSIADNLGSYAVSQTINGLPEKEIPSGSQTEVITDQKATSETLNTSELLGQSEPALSSEEVPGYSGDLQEVELSDQAKEINEFAKGYAIDIINSAMNKVNSEMNQESSPTKGAESEAGLVASSSRTSGDDKVEEQESSSTLDEAASSVSDRVGKLEKMSTKAQASLAKIPELSRSLSGKLKSSGSVSSIKQRFEAQDSSNVVKGEAATSSQSQKSDVLGQEEKSNEENASVLEASAANPSEQEKQSTEPRESKDFESKNTEEITPGTSLLSGSTATEVEVPGGKFK